MKIIEELYYGNLRPYAQREDSVSVVSELMALRDKNMDRLLASLNEDEKELFEKFIDSWAEMNELIRYEKFSRGFSVGVMIMAEALAGIGKLED